MWWHTVTHGRGSEGETGDWSGYRTLHTTAEHGVSSITTITIAGAHTSATSSRMNWRPPRFNWTRPFRRKTKSGFCAYAITFHTQSTDNDRFYEKRFLDLREYLPKYVCSAQYGFFLYCVDVLSRCVAEVFSEWFWNGSICPYYYRYRFCLYTTNALYFCCKVFIFSSLL